MCEIEMNLDATDLQICLTRFNNGRDDDGLLSTLKYYLFYD